MMSTENQRKSEFAKRVTDGLAETITQTRKGVDAMVASPFRILSTLADFEALSVNSVIMTEGGETYGKFSSAWVTFGHMTEYSTGDVAHEAPAWVLYEPAGER